MKKLSYFKINFYSHFKNNKSDRIIFLFLFLFFSMLSFDCFANTQSIKLAIGKYECISGDDCPGDDQYCDIDAHICRTHPKTECNPDEICEICPEPEAGCNNNSECPGGEKCLNRMCVECTGDSECPTAHFCIDNVCRSGCTKNEDCMDDEAPRCFTELGVCLPCPEERPYFDTTMRECREVCKSNADCKDEMRPFCRIPEGEKFGNCTCPDKSSYSPVWQTCAYTKQAALDGGKGRGYKGSPWRGGNNDAATPFLEADYVFIPLDCSYSGELYYYKNGGYLAGPNVCNTRYVYKAGDSFDIQLHNGRKKNYSYARAYYSFVYKDKFKPMTGADCTGDRPIMKADGRCLDCDVLSDGAIVDTPENCYKCDDGKWYAAHSSKGGTDNVCRLCVSGNYWYYADQEQCLKCPNRMHRANDTGCIDCSYSSTVGDMTKEECTRCPNRRWTETNTTTHLGNCYLCASGAEVNTSGELCTQCDAEHPIEKANVTSSGCIACANLTNGTSVASDEDCHKCGDNLWYAGKYSKTDTVYHYCRPCVMGNDYYYANKEECETCNNTLYRSSDNICFDCSYTGYLTAVTPEECHRCANRLIEKNTYCYPCTAGTLTTTHEECLRCPNRYWTANTSNDGYGTCYLCPNGAKANEDGLSCGCSAEEVKLSDGRCFSCSQLSNGISVDTNDVEASIAKCHACDYVYLQNYKKCYNCDTNIGTLSTTTKEECDSCETNRYWKETNTTTHMGDCYVCPAGTIGDDTGYNCICDREHPIALVNTNSNGCIDCASLSNGKQVASDAECHKCGDNLWYAGKESKTDTIYHKCRPCVMGNDYYYANKEECETCNNTFYRSSDNICFDCSYTGYVPTITPEECHRCANRLIEKNTYCYPCTAGTLTTTHEECLRCSNRYWTANTSNDGYGSCYLCPNGSAINNGTACGCTKSNEVTTTAGKCILCSDLTEGTAVSESAQCHKCSGWITTTDNKCYKCDSQYVYNVSQTECNRCSNHLWRSADQTCYQCSYPYKMYNTTKAECDKCSNRVWTETDSTTHLGFCSPAEGNS